MMYIYNFKNYFGVYFILFCFVFNRFFELKGIYNLEVIIILMYNMFE